MKDRELFEEYKRNPTIELRNRIYRRNTGLINAVVRKTISHSDWLLDDYFQEAGLGLIHAIEKFDPSKGYEFSSYAYLCMKGYVLDYYRSKAHTIRVPAQHRMLTAKANQFTRLFRCQNRRNPTEQELAEGIGETPNRLRTVLATLKTTKCLSLDVKISESEDITLFDLVSDQYCHQIEQAIESNMLMSQAVSVLSTEQLSIIHDVFFKQKCPTQIGRERGVTYKVIRRKYDQAIKMMREALAA